MFRLTKDEFTEVVANCDYLQNLKYRSTLPYVFTEQGVAMLVAVFNTAWRTEYVLAMNNARGIYPEQCACPQKLKR